MLFIIKSNDTSQHKQILRFIKKEDIAVLIQDAVLSCHNPEDNFIKSIKEKGVQIFALDQDIKLRGIKNKASLKTIDYEGLVKLIENNAVYS